MSDIIIPLICLVFYGVGVISGWHGRGWHAELQEYKREEERDKQWDNMHIM
jgi:hypothetical protein